jgi:hypothetical protein
MARAACCVVRSERVSSADGRVFECRGGGFGRLHGVFDDKLAIELLRYCTGPDLCRIAVVSRALYVFAHETELWRDLVLSAAFADRFTFHTDWKRTFAFHTLLDRMRVRNGTAPPPAPPAAAAAKSASTSASASMMCDDVPGGTSFVDEKKAGAAAAPVRGRGARATESETAAVLAQLPAHRPLRVSGLYSDVLFDVFLCSSLDVSPYADGCPGSESMARVPLSAGLTVAQFVDRYERPLQPVVLEGLATRWPAFADPQRKWNTDNLMRQYGDAIFKTGRTVMTLTDYFKYARETKEETPMSVCSAPLASRHDAACADPPVALRVVWRAVTCSTMHTARSFRDC